MNFSPIISPKDSHKTTPAIALFGGGGKTSLLYQFGKDLSFKDQKILLSSIVKAGPSPYFQFHFAHPSRPIQYLFDKDNPIYIMKEKIRNDKYIGFESDELIPWLNDVDICLFEADGARDLPLKAHHQYDPILPSYTTQAIIVIGADAVNTKLSDGKIHRPGLFKEMWNMSTDSLIDVKLITEVTTTKKGYLAKIHESIEKTYFINKADAYPQNAQRLAESIAHQNCGSVYFGSVKEKWWKKAS
ncbi:MAG: putative selenium-dependent hydroxylase accessory protein YqeC [Candidatus Marinimicrobia bacterium]|nr:putative selenium-dependent hydroxylase accessory protein YqeC [Candidatus Neomarinimicrobiota bacterium]